MNELPLSATFTALDFGNDYFHACYYLRADEDEALRELQARCVATLGGAAPAGYPPHVSLAYGVLSQERRATAAALITELPVTIVFDRLERWEAVASSRAGASCLRRLHPRRPASVWFPPLLRRSVANSKLGVRERRWRFGCDARHDVLGRASEPCSGCHASVQTGPQLAVGHAG